MYATSTNKIIFFSGFLATSFDKSNILSQSSSGTLYPVGLWAGVFNIVNILSCLEAISKNFSLKELKLKLLFSSNSWYVVTFLPTSSLIFTYGLQNQSDVNISSPSLV